MRRGAEICSEADRTPSLAPRGWLVLRFCKASLSLGPFY